MLRRVAFLCLVLGLATATSWAAPAPPEGTDPGEAAAPEETVTESVKRYQYVETLEITSGSSTLRLDSNVFVIVTTAPNSVMVELLSATGRQPRKDDPASGKVTVVAGGTGKVSWEIKPLVAKFSFGPWAKGMMNVEGLNESALREIASVLGQGPVSNSLEPNRTTKYRIALESRGHPVTLKCQQKNGPHWVDWTVTSDGGLAVGARAWTLPITFSLPEQEAGATGMRLKAEAKMVYSSAIPGPEEGTRLTTTLTYPKRGKGLTYTRTCTLTVADEGEAAGKRPGKKRSRLSAKTDLGGKASAWARTATLATLGVQRLGGVREAGLAMWVAQLGIDSLAGAEISRVASRGVRESVATLAKLSPDIGPLSSMPEFDIGIRNLIRAEAGVSAVEMTAMADGVEDTRTSGVPTLSIAIRRKVGKNWRVGAGVDTVWMNTNTKEPDQTWLYAGIVGRGEYSKGSSTYSFSAGLAKVRYDMSSSSRQASGDFWVPAFGLEWEWWSRGKLGLGAKLQSASGDGVTMTLIQPSLRWRLGRKRTALQFHLTMLNVSDAQAVGGEISAEGTGGGAGILIRW